jgi:phosphoglycolate phosphatase
VGKVVFEETLGRPPSQEEVDALMRRRLDYLPEEVADSPGYAVKEGVVELLEKLRDDGILLGLTTGNVEEAAHIKLARGDLDRFFSFGGYGSDSPDRTELTKTALQRAESAYGDGFERDRCITCGDTPRDVEAGHGAGIRVVAVATGEFTLDELNEAGADAVVASLREGLPLL